MSTRGNCVWGASRAFFKRSKDDKGQTYSQMVRKLQLQPFQHYPNYFLSIDHWNLRQYSRQFNPIQLYSSQLNFGQIPPPIFKQLDSTRVERKFLIFLKGIFHPSGKKHIFESSFSSVWKGNVILKVPFGEFCIYIWSISYLSIVHLIYQRSKWFILWKNPLQPFEV